MSNDIKCQKNKVFKLGMKICNLIKSGSCAAAPHSNKCGTCISKSPLGFSGELQTQRLYAGKFI